MCGSLGGSPPAAVKDRVVSSTTWRDSRVPSRSEPVDARSLDPGPWPVLRDPARQLRRLPDPARHELLVELVVIVYVEVARVLVLGFAGREWSQRRAAEESHFDVLREAMEAEEPALPLDAIEGRVPLDCLAHVGHGAHDERVEAA